MNELQERILNKVEKIFFSPSDGLDDESANEIISMVLDEVITVSRRYFYKDTIGDASALTDTEIDSNTRLRHLIKAIEKLKDSK